MKCFSLCKKLDTPMEKNVENESEYVRLALNIKKCRGMLTYTKKLNFKKYTVLSTEHDKDW
jgi:hypothetical protein